jgi:signal transduction histidine kinase
MALTQMGEVRRLMNNGEALSFQTQVLVNELMIESLEYVFLGFGVFILFSFGFALITSHRIAGPQVAIKAVIEDMKEGNYEPKRNLRPSDELQEVMIAVKELAEILNTKDSGKT